MKLGEAWHLSKTCYKEMVYRSLAEERGRMWWGAFGRNQQNKERQDDLELTQRALRIAKFDKGIVAVFNVIVSLAPFFSLILGIRGFGLTSAVSLSLAVTFGFTSLYAIQTLASFMSPESSAFLTAMPLDREDFSLITLFSFIRSFDYMVVGSFVSQVVLVAYLTASPLAVIIMLAASTLNSIFAVAVALWFSQMFQRNLMRGGRSRSSTLFRLFFILMWGLLLVAVGFLFSAPWYIVPNLQAYLLGPASLWTILVDLLYPFSAGIAVTAVSSSGVALVSVLSSSVSLGIYVLLGTFAGKWSLQTVRRISMGSGLAVSRVRARDFCFHHRGVISGYAMKDLRVASRNPATAFFFAFPVVETVIIILLNSGFTSLRTTLLLTGTSLGAIFALFLPFALLSAEGKGLEYTKTLPISQRVIILPKALISTAAFAPVPFALAALSFVKPLTSPFAIVIPFLTILAVASASVLEIKLFLRTAARSRISSLISDFEKLTVGMLVVLAPMGTYSATYLSTLDHGFSLLAMAAVTLMELALVSYWLRRS